MESAQSKSPVAPPTHRARSRCGGWTRREFVVGALAAGATAVGSWSGCARLASSAAGGRRKKIALLATIVRRHSHAQHFIDRFLEGYGWQGRWHKPAVDLVSLYVDQYPQNDLARDRSQRFGVPIYPTIEESLTCGGPRLAVDGVVIIGEHGTYPRNEKGQTLYPRYEWYKKITRFFEADGRSVPVFNDKHLSTSWSECREMVDDARRLGFAFLAGSSLPVTWRLPAIDLPFNTRLRESLCVCYGGVDAYDFHGLETAQCMSERRAGGERGVRSIHALRGGQVWDRIGRSAPTLELLFAALARSHTTRPARNLTVFVPSLDRIREACPQPVGYFIEHTDGFRTTMIMANGFVQDFTYAGRTEGGEVLSCQMYLPMPMQSSTTADFFNPLIHHIEQLVIEQRAAYPIERTLLTSGMTLFAVESLHRGQPIATPEMAVRYTANRASTFWPG